MKIAIIGSGMAGLTCATYLSSHFDVTIFEKSRGVGGRMATRRNQSFSFDHGAQYFTAKGDAFREFIQAPALNSSIKKWPIQLHNISHENRLNPVDDKRELLVSSPTMTAFPKVLANDLHIIHSNEIISIKGGVRHWQLFDKSGDAYGPFDFVIVTAPAPQSLKLLPDLFSFKGDIDQVRMAGCFSLMLGFKKDLPLPFQAAFCESSPLGWICANHSKPLREKATSLLLQSTKKWAEEFMEADKGEIQKTLLDEACEKTGLDLKDFQHIDSHRWRYASVTNPAQKAFFLDDIAGLAACGDWCIKGRIEAAFESGRQLALALNAL